MINTKFTLMSYFSQNDENTLVMGNCYYLLTDRWNLDYGLMNLAGIVEELKNSAVSRFNSSPNFL